jgi:hypothetical protein
MTSVMIGVTWIPSIAPRPNEITIEHSTTSTPANRQLRRRSDALQHTYQ